MISEPHPSRTDVDSRVSPYHQLCRRLVEVCLIGAVVACGVDSGASDQSSGGTEVAVDPAVVPAAKRAAAAKGAPATQGASAAGEGGGSDAPETTGLNLAGGHAGGGSGSPVEGLHNETLADSIQRALVAAAIHLDQPLDLSDLEVALTATPAELEPSLDRSLLQPEDPSDFPAATHIGGIPVMIIRERHRSTGVLLRIATVRATTADTESSDPRAVDDGEDAAVEARPILHGPEWLYHDSGALRSTLWWNQDVKHGPIKQWRPVGTCIFEGRFSNGQRDGLRREYSKAGKLLQLQVYAGGNPHGPYRAWFASGQEKEQAYFVRGRFEGPRKVWGRTGLLVISEQYKAGLRDGNWSDFDPEAGTPRSWGTFAKGKRVGVWQTGSPSGVLLESKEYEEGLMHGEAKVWAPTGDLIERSFYHRGRQTGLSATWYASGTHQSEGELVDGARTGPWVYWREDGSINDTWSGNYKNDLRVSPLEKPPETNPGR